MARGTPLVEDGILRLDEPIDVGSLEWFAWLESVERFGFRSADGSFTARKEGRQRGGMYWIAYRKRDGKLKRVYLGTSSGLTLASLQAAARKLAAASESSTTAPAGQADGETLLLATKLSIPPARGDLIPRPRLYSRLAAIRGRRLLAISAPAGYGKTTLLAEWIASQRVGGWVSGEPIARQQVGAEQQAGENTAFAWLTLDPSDDDPARFWTYLLAAVDKARPGPGAAARAALSNAGGAPIERVLTLLINSLAQQEGDLILVLDDFHTISNSAIHDGLLYLLRNMPGRLHLILAGRNEPALALASLRAAGELIELHAGDLRCSAEESAGFLRLATNGRLSASEMATLEARTEGWIAGLRLAALALGAQADTATLLWSFGGEHRYVFDYLAGEVLGRQEPEVRDFLLRTAILDRLSVPLCDALVAGGSRRMLDYMERASLFLVPLDDERRWYRYHQLFAEFLRGRLSEIDPEAPAMLHARAARWYEEQGAVVEAAQHWLAGGNFERVARLIEQHGQTLLLRRQTVTLLGWLAALPSELVRSRSRLSFYRAAALVLSGAIEDADQHLHNSVRAAGAEGAVVEALGQVSALRAAVAVLRGRAAQAMALAQQAFGFAAAGDTLASGLAHIALGLASAATGDVERAVQTLAAGARAARAGGNRDICGAALAGLGYVQSVKGELREAAATYREAIGGETPEGLMLPVAGMAHGGLATLLYEWNDLSAAAKHARQGIELAQRWGSVEVGLVVRLALAQIAQAAGDERGAMESIEEALRQAEQAGANRLAALASAGRATLLLRQGRLAGAARWAARCDLKHDWYGFEHGAEHLALARILIAQGTELRNRELIREGMQVLDRLRRAAEASGWGARRVRALALQAVGHQAMGNGEIALVLLKSALYLAEAQDYKRTFCDEGPSLQALLRRLAQSQPSAYLMRLLDCFSAGEEPAARGAGTVEPLSGREQEVLRLLLAGRSDADIGQRLVVAESTVKWYLKILYRKLDVHSRAEAIVVGQRLIGV